MNVDGSSTSIIFSHKVPVQTSFLLHTQVVYILEADEFGNVPGPPPTQLANGVLVQILDELDAVVYDPLNGEAIKMGLDFVALAGTNIRVVGDKGFAAVWNWSHGGSRGLRIPPNFSIAMTIQDDLTNLDIFRSSIQGFTIPNG